MTYYRLISYRYEFGFIPIIRNKTRYYWFLWKEDKSEPIDIWHAWYSINYSRTQQTSVIIWIFSKTIVDRSFLLCFKVNNANYFRYLTYFPIISTNMFVQSEYYSIELMYLIRQDFSLNFYFLNEKSQILRYFFKLNFYCSTQIQLFFRFNVMESVLFSDIFFHRNLPALSWHGIVADILSGCPCISSGCWFKLGGWKNSNILRVFFETSLS